MSQWFPIDIVATFPLEYILEDGGPINTQFVKSLKITRVIKLVRIIKLSKILSFLNLNNVIKSELGKLAQLIYKRHRGQLDLFTNILFIFLMAHFFTIIFQFFKTQDIIEIDDRYQLIDDINLIYDVPEYNQSENSIYFQMLSRHVQMAFGLETVRLNKIEDLMIMNLWVVTGISLFGQSIGNISSYLNQSRKEDIEQGEHINFFNEICTFHNMDESLRNLVLRDINEQFNNYQDRELITKGVTLSKSVYIQLEIAMQQSFVESFDLFRELSVNAIRILKKSHIKMSQNILIRKEQEIPGLIMVTQGKFQLQDDQMELKNEFSKNMIFGMSSFFKQQSLKYDVALDNIIERNNSSDMNSNQKSNKISSILRQNNSSARASSSNLPFEVVESKAIIKSNFNAQGSKDIEYMLFNQISVEELMHHDFTSFNLIKKQQDNQESKMSEHEISKCDSAWQNWYNTPEPSFICIGDGEDEGLIYELNQTSEDYLNQNEIHSLIDMNLFGFNPCVYNDNHETVDKANPETDNRVLHLCDLLKDIIQILNIDNKQYKMSITDIKQIKLNKLKSKFPNQKVRLEQLCLRKNLLKLQSISYKFEKV